MTMDEIPGPSASIDEQTDTTDTGETDVLADVVDSLQAQEYDVARPLPGVLHVTGRFSNAERLAHLAAERGRDHALAIWATNHHGDWALVAWNRPDLVTITQRGAVPRRWRHRRIPEQMGPGAQTFLEGGPSQFDIVTRPKHQPTDAARAVLAGFSIADPAPPGWVPPVVVAPEPEAKVVKAAPKRVSTPRAPKPKPEPKRTEPVVKVCPTCFMALPATGICDNCG